MTMSSAPSLPVSSTERIAALDIVRGLALFGVLQINLVFFSGHIYQEWAGATYALGWGGPALSWVRDHLIAEKSMFCFSMLFGVGLSIQMERALARGQAFGGFALRRLGALAILGITHATLIWSGDILLVYAVTGLILVPLLRARVRTILIAAGIGFMVSSNYKIILGWMHVPNWLLFSHWYKQAPWLLHSANQAYGNGTWMEAAHWRIWEWNHVGRAIDILSVFGCLPPFLLGLALWRIGILRDTTGRVRSVRRIFHAAFWFGIAFSLVPFAWFAHIPKPWEAGWRGMLLRGLFQAGPLTLALGYFMGILLLLQRERWSRWLSHLAPMGRMALTNYLTQSLVCTWIFNAHGLGLWGRIPPAGYILGGIGLYGCQIALSRWWLTRFSFGPAEWLWRSMTYGQMQQFKLQRPTTHEAVTEPSA